MAVMGQELCVNGFAIVGGFADEQVMQRATQAVNVCSGIGVLRAEALLGSHVVDGAHDGSGAGQFGLGGRVATASIRASPMSRIFTTPSLSSSRLAGLISR